MTWPVFSQMCQDLLCVRSEEAVQHPCILATLSEMWLVLGTQLFIEKIHYRMVTQQPAAIAERRPTQPSTAAAVLWSGLVTWVTASVWGWEWCGGVFIKNCARIRGKLAGNWRHLQNKREEVLLWGQMELWPGLHTFIGGGILGIFFVFFLVC